MSGRVQGALTRLGRGRFVRAAAQLQAGSLLLTGVGFVSSVLLARTLGASGYGLYSLVMSTGTTIGLLRRLGQDYAATTHVAEGYAAGDRRVVRDALVFYAHLSVLTSIVVLPPAILLAPWLAERFFGEPQMGGLLQLYLIQGFWAVVPGGTVIALQGAREIGALVRFESVTSTLGSVLPVALVLLGLGVVGVFWGQIAAGLVALIAGVVVYRRLSDRDRLLPSMGELLAGIARPGLPLWKKTRFGLSIAIDKNLVSLYNLMPFLLLGAFASEADVGQLRVAVSYMAIPAVLLSPVSRLLMVDLPQLRATDPARVRRFFVKVTLLGCLASTALAVPFALVAPVFVPLVYGQDFGEASWLVLPLLLDAASLGLGIAAGPIFRTYDRTDLPIRASLVILALGLPAAVLGIRMWGALGAALVYAGMLLASRLVSYVQCLRIVPR